PNREHHRFSPFYRPWPDTCNHPFGSRRYGTLLLFFHNASSRLRNLNLPELSCTPSALGNYTVEGFVSDATGQTSMGYLSVTVNSVIRISTFTTSPESVDLGEEVTLAVSTTGGAGPLTYSYSDLPTGCLSADSPTLHCTRSTSGTYLVKATVTDHAGKNATSSLNITVLPARVIGPSLNQEELLVGGIITSLIAISLVIMVLSKRRKGP